MALFSKELGIDLGTINVLICEGGQIVLHEPSVVAIAVAEQKIVAVGQEAKDMYGRAPAGLAVMEAPLEAGAREVFLIPEPLAAALGADLPVATPTGNTVVDLGGGATEAAVVSMSGIVSAHTARVGGMKLDEAIMTYIRKKYALGVGDPTAEG